MGIKGLSDARTNHAARQITNISEIYLHRHNNNNKDKKPSCR